MTVKNVSDVIYFSIFFPLKIKYNAACVKNWQIYIFTCVIFSNSFLKLMHVRNDLQIDPEMYVFASVVRVRVREGARINGKVIGKHASMGKSKCND